MNGNRLSTTAALVVTGVTLALAPFLAWGQGAPAKATKPARQAAVEGAARQATAAPDAKPYRTLQPPAAEIAYRAKVKALVAPLLAIEPAPDEIKKLKDAIRDHTAASRQALADPAARKLALWQSLKAGAGEPQEFLRFIADNPAWPDAQMLMRRAEEQLFSRGGNSADIRAFFKDREPVSGAGWAALASAHLLEGDEASARKLAQRAWNDEEMSATFEHGFLDRFGKLLTTTDHRRRLDRIVIDRLQMASERRARAAIARRVIPLLPEPERKSAEARLAAFLKDKGAAKLLAALPEPEAGKPDWGVAFAKAAAALDSGQLETANAILTRIPVDKDVLVSPDDWWLLRREAAFRAMGTGKPEIAYALVKTSGPLSVNPLKEQTHMAGFIALRFLKKPETALAHFEASRKAADGPLSRARSAYWLARTLDALGRKGEAKELYRSATRDPDTFHALLSRQIIAGGPETDLVVELPKMPTAEDAQHFLALDVVRAAVIAKRAGLDRNIVVGLFAGARNYLKSEPELALLAETAASLGDAQTSLRIGKAAIARGQNLITYAYPIDPFPVYDPIRPPPETALLLGVARQETEFHMDTVSTAGARGLLQVMQVTAEHVCMQHKVHCDFPRLLTDRVYNVQMASAYIADRMAEFGGWYVVTLPGYNAGPGRARQWIRQNGDPRQPGVDPIDWMEQIPIEETRQYVEKVLSNIQIYRARLGEKKPLRLQEDLAMATGFKRTAAE